MNDKVKIRKLETLDYAKYENIDLDHLIMYVINRLKKIKVDLSYENIVVAAFMIFPEKFSLPGFHEYPDSNRVEQCLWRCTSKIKQWLGGKTRQGFLITDRSKRIFKETDDLLSGIIHKKTKATSQTRRKELILNEVLSSTAYKKYKDGNENLISEADFCFLLQGTLDSSKETLNANYFSLKKYSEELKNKNIFDFLENLKKKFKSFLNL